MTKLLYIAVATSIFAGCSKPDVDDHGITESNLNAEFNITPVSGSAHKFVITASDSSYIFSKWDLDNGAGAVAGKHSQEIFLPDAGIYKITHYAVGKGGAAFSASKTVTIATSDPASGNLVQGGKFESAADEAKWTKITIDGTSVSWSRANGKMTVSGGGNSGHAAIYQAIQVQANKDYRFGMIVSGSGATNTWFEVYFGTTMPEGGKDYSSGGTQIGLNTWEGCGSSAFSGNIATIGCAGALKDKSGKVRFAQSGTIYLLIKCGGDNLGTSGISIDNVELRGI
jgi:hypothetical protein